MLGDNIKKFRENLNISQRELGRRIDKTGQFISLIEQGKSNPSIDVLGKISEVLGVTINDLIGNMFSLPPISFEETISKVNTMFPALEAEIKFLSDPKVENTFHYSFDGLAKQGGYQELLILAVEKAIKETLNDINRHLEAGDLFDGVCSWISKESPLYAIIKEKNEK